MWDQCKIEAMENIKAKAGQEGSIRKSIKIIAEESGIPEATLSRWYWPDSNRKYEDNRPARKSVVLSESDSSQTDESEDTIEDVIEDVIEHKDIAENVIEENSLPLNRDKHIPHVAQNTGNNEWYTPPVFIEAVRAVLGKIDLDPASSEIANKTVKAERFYTKEDNGIECEWYGKVFLNPPYSQPLIKNFLEKLALSLSEGAVSEAIVLVNNATDTQWFQDIAFHASIFCFVNKRIKFLDANGNSGAPLQGQAILYFENGKSGDFLAFKNKFSEFGIILENPERI